MSNTQAEGQAANIQPPKVGEMLVITLDATSRRYDLGGVAWGGKAVDRAGDIFMSLYGDVAFYFATNDTNAGTVDETAALAAGGAVSAFTTNAAWQVPAGVEVSFRFNRARHRYLVIKGSAAGKVRIYASSDTTGR